jgi:hypothetical protein
MCLNTYLYTGTKGRQATSEQLSFFSFLAYHHILHADPHGLPYEEKVKRIALKSIKYHNEDFVIWLEDNKVFLKDKLRVVSCYFVYSDTI